jgi:hypothetical protein
MSEPEIVIVIGLIVVALAFMAFGGLLVYCLLYVPLLREFVKTRNMIFYGSIHEPTDEQIVQNWRDYFSWRDRVALSKTQIISLGVGEEK